MRLHLPVSLFRALLACMAAVSFVSFTSATSTCFAAPEEEEEGNELLMLLSEQEYPNGSKTYTTCQTSALTLMGYESILFKVISSTSSSGATYNSTGATFTLSGNGAVTFSGNTASSYGGAIYNEGSFTLSGNGAVTFSGNTGSCAGGAIDNVGTFTLSGNGAVTFSGNTASNYTSSEGGAIDNVGTFTLSGNGAVTFSGNTASSYGGAISNRDGTFTLSGNGAVTFSGNTGSCAGGAIYNDDGTFTLSGNGDVTFSGNTSHAIHNSGTFSLSRNGNVSFIGNTGFDFGGAIDNGGTFTLSGNGDVLFERNAEILNGTYRLRSIYSEGTLNLSASAGKSILFRDSVYASGAVSLNQDGTGDIIFTGAYTENDLQELKGQAASYTEIQRSLVSQFHADVTLGGGSLQVQEGAKLTFAGLSVGDSSRSASLQLQNGWVDVSEPLTLAPRSSLSFSGCNYLLSSRIVAEGNNTLSLTISEENRQQAALSVVGTLRGEPVVIDLGDVSRLNGNNYHILHVIGNSTGWKTADIRFTGASGVVLTWVNGDLYYRYDGSPAPQPGADRTIADRMTAESFELLSGYKSLTFDGGRSGILNSDYAVILDNESVLFSGNTASSDGGAIDNDGTFTLSGNGAVTFSGNTASSSSTFGGAISNSGTFTLSGNGEVTFSGNTASSSYPSYYNHSNGGAIFNGGTFTLSGNGAVTFSGNTASSSSYYYSNGGAIDNSGTFTLSDNGDVLFESNAEILNGTYRLRSIYSMGTLNLSASAGKSILFKDSVYADGTVSLNQDGTGDIIFTGAYTENDLLELKGQAASYTEIQRSLVSQFHADVTLGGGSLQVQEGAKLTFAGLAVGGAQSASLQLQNGWVDVSEPLTLAPRSSLSFSGCNYLLSSGIVAEGNNILSLTIGEETRQQAALSVVGALQGEPVVIDLGDVSRLNGNNYHILHVIGNSAGWKTADIRFTGASAEELTWVNGDLYYRYDGSPAPQPGADRIIAHRMTAESFELLSGYKSLTFDGRNSGIKNSDYAVILDNESVLFSGNTSHAIHNSGTFTLSGNGEVTFSGNTASSGGAIYNDGTFTLSGNGAVLFEKNAEVRSGTYRLRSIYSTGTLKLSSSEGKSITFHDSVYAKGKVNLNQDGTGDIIFTGSTTEADLREVKGGVSGTWQEMEDSRSSELDASVILGGGTLQVRDGASLTVKNLTAANCSELVIHNANFTVTGDSTLAAVSISGSADIAVQDGATLTLQQIITNNGMLTIGGTLDVSAMILNSTAATHVDVNGNIGASGFAKDAVYSVQVVNGGTVVNNGATVTHGSHTLTLGSNGVATEVGAVDYGSYLLTGTSTATSSAIHGKSSTAIIQQTGGTLTVNDTATVNATGGTVVLSSGTLDGSLNNVTVNAAGGTLAADMRGGKLAVNGNVNLAGYAHTSIELNSGRLTAAETLELENGQSLSFKGGRLTGDVLTGTGSTLTLGSNATLNGDLTLDGGQLALNGNTLAVAGALNLVSTTSVDISSYAIGTYKLLTFGALEGRLDNLVLSGGRYRTSVSEENGALTLTVKALNNNLTWTQLKGTWSNLGSFGTGVFRADDDVNFRSAANVTISGTVAPGSVLVNTPGNVVLVADKKVYGSGINGEGCVTKSGAGMLTMNAGNTYSGGTTLNAGTLKATAVDSFGTGVITVKGGVLDLGSKAVANAIVLSGTATFKGDAKYVGCVTVAGDAALSAKTSYKGMTTIGEGSTLTLAEKATMAGSIAVDGGSLKITAPKGMTLAKGATMTLDKGGSVSGLVTISAGSTLVWADGGFETAAPVLKGGTLQLGGEGMLTLAGSKAQVAFGNKHMELPGKGVVYTDETLTVNGGTVTLSAVSGYESGIEVAGGTLKLSTGKVTTDNEITVSGDAAVVNGKTHNGNITVNGTLTKGSNITIAADKTVELNGAGTMLGSITGAGSVNVNASIDATAAKITAAHINLNSGTYTNTKGIKLAKGQTLTLGGVALNLGPKGALATVAGSTLAVSGSNTLSGSLTLGGGELVFEGGSLAVDGTLTLSKAMTVSGSGTITYKTLKPFKGDIAALFNGAEVELDAESGTLTINGGAPKVVGLAAEPAADDVSAAMIAETEKLAPAPPDAAHAPMPVADPVADAMVQADWGIIDAERAFLGAVNSRHQHAALLDKGQGAAWVSAFGSSVRHGNKGAHHGSDGNIEGAAFGLEHAVSETGSIGLAVGRSKNRIAATGVTHLRQETAHVALYGQKQLAHGFTADAAASYGDTETKLGAASWQQKSAALTARLTHAQQLTDATAFRTFGGLTYEATDAGSIGTAHTGSVQNFRGELGAGITHTAGKAHLYAEAALTGDMVRHNPTADLGGFRTHGANPGRIGVRATIGGLYEFTDTWSGTASYGIEAESRSTSHTFNVGVSKSF